MIAESSIRPEATEVSSVFVTLSFFSTPTWPDSGESEDIVVLPLEEWRTPGQRKSFCPLGTANHGTDQIKSLPRHPLKARIMGAQYSAGPNGLKTPYLELESIICEASLVGEKRTPISHEQAPLVMTPALFSWNDEEVVFRSRDESKTLGNLSLLRIGCW